MERSATDTNLNCLPSWTSRVETSCVCVYRHIQNVVWIIVKHLWYCCTEYELFYSSRVQAKWNSEWGDPFYEVLKHYAPFPLNVFTSTLLCTVKLNPFWDVIFWQFYIVIFNTDQKLVRPEWVISLPISLLGVDWFYFGKKCVLMTHAYWSDKHF